MRRSVVDRGDACKGNSSARLLELVVEKPVDPKASSAAKKERNVRDVMVDVECCSYVKLLVVCIDMWQHLITSYF
jgi:hypothetical protein